jgi:hypothetical protein
MIVLTSIFYLKDNPAQCERARQLYAELSAATSAAGYQQYRVGTSGMLSLANSAPGFIAFAKALKSAADPAGILSPGKYAI